MSAAALIIALLSAGLMGMAIQRGATCMVAAVDEALVHRRLGRAGALAEAASWAVGLLAIARLGGLFKEIPAQFAISGWTVTGGVLLGLGAWVNRACVFGSIARIGSGQWAWLASPVGFFAGSLLPLNGPSPSGAAPFTFPAALAALVFACLFIWRAFETGRSANVTEHLWHPHRATLLIGVTFVSTMLTVGMWAYTDALAALARPASGMDPRLATRGAMVAVLLAGAVIGGRIAGTLRPERPRFATALRCLAGGAMMGVGAMLVPGSNDGLIMLGMPLLQPHAWVAVITMTLTIASAIVLSRWRALVGSSSLAA